MFSILLNIGCDQATKEIARNHIDYDQKITVIEDVFSLMRVENTGAFLSLGSELGSYSKCILLNILPLLVLCIFLVYVLFNKEFSLNKALTISFIVGGGFGNLYDRIIYGSVTDFMHIDFYLFETGIFNMADLSIVIGLVWFLIDSVKIRKSPQ
ncbi:MAG: signal peptidase II [Candidatus Kapaibacteriales bacterium]